MYERENPTIEEPTDAIIKIAATCVCGSDLWPYRGIEDVDHAPMGHEYVGTVTEVGDQVSTVKVGDFVVGSFFASDNTCEICRAGYQSRCVHAEPMGAIGTQAEYARVPHADGTLVATPGQPDADLIPSLLAASDVLGTGWFGAVAGRGGPGEDGGRRRRRCGGSSRCPRRSAARRRPDHRDESARRPAGARP
ncbi:Alcohol dehydrogenase GroES-like domain-containing protein [Gordonia westfalica]|uniref:Alcohol dehydrogenase GroES-like domain-containing protein n=1 Tax=Gordonia westfalica TaxID=158898 RepID=A0A1H2LFQ4_9ACTN|nr:Alcohol dehydrogenase GroES-like domain-containing protein [Gordonia westfalica]